MKSMLGFIIYLCVSCRFFVICSEKKQIPTFQLKSFSKLILGISIGRKISIDTNSVRYPSLHAFPILLVIFKHLVVERISPV